MEDDWEREAEQQRRDEETFRRIHQLVKRGYVPDWSLGDVEDAIWFEHPGDAPRIILYPDGKIVATNGSGILDPNAKFDRDRIYNEEKIDTSIFDNWLKSILLPTWRQRTRADREKYIMIPGCMLLVYSGFFVVIWLISRWWNGTD